MVAAMTRTLALAAVAVAAAASFAQPATAAPCDLPYQTRPCLDPIRYKLEHLCFPPNPADLYGC